MMSVCKSSLGLAGGHKTVYTIVDTGRLILVKLIVFLFCVVVVVLLVWVESAVFGWFFSFGCAAKSCLASPDVRCFGLCVVTVEVSVVGDFGMESEILGLPELVECWN